LGDVAIKRAARRDFVPPTEIPCPLFFNVESVSGAGTPEESLTLVGIEVYNHPLDLKKVSGTIVVGDSPQQKMALDTL
jgi:hypothetical protein